MPRILSRAVEHEDLGDLLNVGHDVEVREHHALGIAGAAAGEDDGGQLIHRSIALRRVRARAEARSAPSMRLQQ